jgi:hypothetical protein
MGDKTKGGHWSRIFARASIIIDQDYAAQSLVWELPILYMYSMSQKKKRQ